MKKTPKNTLKYLALIAIPYLTLAQSLDIGAKTQLTSQIDFLKKDKKEFISKMVTASGVSKVSAIIKNGTSETTLFSHQEQMQDLGETQNKRCFGVEEGFVLNKKSLNYKVKGYCALDKEEIDRIKDIIIYAGIVEEFKNRGISSEITESVFNQVKAAVTSDPNSSVQIEEALDLYLKEKYSIDGQEISINEQRDEIRIDINRELKLGNLIKEGSVFKKKIKSFDLDASQMSEIYKITLPLFASEAVDSLELANFMLSKKLNSGAAEFYNKIEVKSFKCALENEDYKCQSELDWDLGFKAKISE
ncbi:hypothetical protein [Bacteriovorax sp. DB6_IX]|uniref:hypothetical protein n=1 Tax=Bacteriovorax sp. DB6_IX TaxID=1353530 RepID=UPI00038A0A8B|nr:hypothetical protein [Bacteriovorax sp. DB6_IX]EQC52588.1 hypothetical protein M901_1873 [Bacteriovorax sp. DB6_IX]